jgi:hypothetical protein
LDDSGFHGRRFAVTNLASRSDCCFVLKSCQKKADGISLLVFLAVGKTATQAFGFDGLRSWCAWIKHLHAV